MSRLSSPPRNSMSNRAESKLQETNSVIAQNPSAEKSRLNGPSLTAFFQAASLNDSNMSILSEARRWKRSPSRKHEPHAANQRSILRSAKNDIHRQQAKFLRATASWRVCVGSLVEMSHAFSPSRSMRIAPLGLV